MLIDQLNAMVDALEGQPARRNPYRGFPINLLERAIHAGLDLIEKKFLGPWEPVRTGFTPGQVNEFMIKWLKGEHIKIKV